MLPYTSKAGNGTYLATKYRITLTCPNWITLLHFDEIIGNICLALLIRQLTIDFRRTVSQVAIHSRKTNICAIDTRRYGPTA